MNVDVAILIDAENGDTRDADTDPHLRSVDLFGVEKFPKITFSSITVFEAEGGCYIINSDLTLEDLICPVSTPHDLLGTDRNLTGTV